MKPVPDTYWYVTLELGPMTHLVLPCGAGAVARPRGVGWCSGELSVLSSPFFLLAPSIIISVYLVSRAWWPFLSREEFGTFSYLVDSCGFMLTQAIHRRSRQLVSFEQLEIRTSTFEFDH